MQKRFIIGTVLMLASILHAQVNGDLEHNIEVPFDVNEIIEQVSNNASKPQGGNITQPLLEPGFLIDTNFVYGPIGYYAYLCGIATNGTNYLVVWYDLRDRSANLYCARVDTAGILLDSVGIQVSMAYSHQHYPAVASDGSDYLVVWCDYGAGNYDIYGARVTTDGAVLDPNGFPICTTTGNQMDPKMSFDGTNYMVVWEDYRTGNNDIYGARIDVSGTVLNEFAICALAQNQQDPVISFNGADYLVAWQDYRNGSDHDVYAQRINTNGGLIGGDIAVCVDTASRAYYPSIAHDGTNHLVVWYDNRNSTYYDIYGARVDADGTVLDTNGFEISVLSGIRQYNPQVAFDGTNYFVVWHHSVSGSGLGYDLYGVRVDTSGTVLDTTAIIEVVGHQLNAQLAFDGTNYLVVWRERRTTSYNVCGLRVDPSGTVLDPGGFLISMAPYMQYRPAVSFDGTNYLIVWEDYRDDFTNKCDIYGARVDATGTILDPNGIAICTEESKNVEPNVAFDGTNYFVVWQDHRNYPDVYGQFISTTGALVGNEVPICTTGSDQYDINLGYGGGKHLVVWQDGADFWNPQIQGQLVDTAGQLAGPIINITNAPDFKYAPCVAFDGTNFMVVWEDHRSGAVYDIYGARIDTSGTVLDTAGLEIVVSFDYKNYPSIAFGGTNYLVAYTEYHVDNDIYARRVDTSGTVLDSIGIVISDAIGSQYPTQVVISDTNYVVIWDDYRNEFTSGIDVYGAILNRSGTVIDSLAISPPGNQLYANLASGQGDQVLIVYSGWVDSLGGRPAQTMRIWGTWGPVVGIEELTDVIARGGLRLQCHPNPFSLATEISYELAENEIQSFSLAIYDVSGRLVKQFNHPTNKPVNTILWDGKDNTGRNLPAGVYFAQLRSDRLTSTKKIIKLK